MFDESSPEQITELMRGAIDLHVHPNPHLLPYAFAPDIMTLAAQAKEAGMRALVIKDVGVPTTGTAYIVSRYGPGILVYGSLTMNLCNGGINPRGVEVALTHADGAKIVYFPTGDTLNHVQYRKKFYAGINLPLPEEKAITVLRDDKLIPEVRDVVALVKQHNRCLATSHLSARESHAVVKEARAQGLERVIITHPQWDMTRLTLDDLKEFARLGCFIEFEAQSLFPLMYLIQGVAPTNPYDVAAAMRAVGIEHSLMSTDLGAIYSPSPVDGLRTYIAILLKCGIEAKEIELMLHRNPARLLGLE